MNEHNITSVSDKHFYNFVDAAIPVLEDLQSISGNWNGDADGKEQEQAQLAIEIFEHLTAVAPLIERLNENA